MKPLPRLTSAQAVTLLLAGWAILALGVAGSLLYAFKIQGETQSDTLALVREHRAAIVEACEDREGIKRAIRELVDFSIRATLERGDLSERELAQIAEYQALVARKLGETPCLP